MSSLNPSGTPSEPQSSAAPDLQFEQAEYDEITPSLACETCKQPIAGEYYLINGSYFCSSCKWAREGPVEPERSSFGRFLRAVVYGTGAAAVGTLIYFAISWATGYEFGLIAIVVGWMVGKAVLSGSGNRGGRVYQALAVFLTYCAIVSSYVPLVVKGLAEASEQQTVQGTTEAPDSGAATGVAGGELPSDTVSMANATPPADPPAPQSSDGEPQQTTGPAPETVDLTSANVGQLLVFLRGCPRYLVSCAVSGRLGKHLWFGDHWHRTFRGLEALGPPRGHNRGSVLRWVARPGRNGNGGGLKMAESVALSQSSPAACAACGCELAPKAVTCPQCHRLVHAERLRQLSTEAEQAASSGETVRALTLWREALELLPPQSRQYNSLRTSARN